VGIEIKYHKVGDLWGIEEVIRDLDNIHENLNLWPNRAAQKGLAVVFIQQDAAQKRFCGAVALEPASVIDSLDAIYVVSRHELWKIASRSDSKTR
jgi:hypothetical protein